MCTSISADIQCLKNNVRINYLYEFKTFKLVYCHSSFPRFKIFIYLLIQ